MHPMTPTFFDELQIYRTVYSRNNPTSLTPEEAFYQISTPFLMDSQLANWFAQKSETVDKSAEEKRKRRKRKRKISEAETFLVEDTQFVMAMHQQFLLSCQDKNSQQNDDIGNKKARDLVRNAPETSLEPSNLGAGQTLSRVEIADACSNQATNSCTRPILYKNERSEFIRVGNFMYPPNCGFLIGDVSLANRLPNQQSGNFDFILMDPPWNNRTVKRQKTYELLRSSRGSTFDQIQHISLPKMLDPNGLLCIWVTNSQVAKKAAAELLEHWQLRRRARWFWLKICKSGEPICPFRPEHKVPFESLIFACHPEAVDKFTDFPENHCLISVPNACPSRKPPISLLLESLGLIQPVRSGLELYGRYLLPNFTTIGFEANRFQHIYYFHENA